MSHVAEHPTDTLASCEFCINHCPLHNAALMWSWSCPNLWVWRDGFRGQFPSVSFSQIIAVHPWGRWGPHSWVLDQVYSMNTCFLLWNRTEIQSESSHPHNTCVPAHTRTYLAIIYYSWAKLLMTFTPVACIVTSGTVVIASGEKASWSVPMWLLHVLWSHCLQQ